jgi:hypothetical protein
MICAPLDGKHDVARQPADATDRTSRLDKLTSRAPSGYLMPSATCSRSAPARSRRCGCRSSAVSALTTLRRSIVSLASSASASGNGVIQRSRR